MALVSSLFTAISGMRAEQTMLDVIGNNVANVNTTGFKAGRVQFRDLLSRGISGATGADPVNNLGGINPMQQGTGAAVASIDTRMTQGTLQATGNATDMAVNGDGFFLVRNGNETLYTRAGSFRFDGAGRLVDAEGALVQGWTAAAPAGDPLGRLTIDSSNPATIGNIQINAGQTLAAHETRQIVLKGNLDSGANYVNLANAPAGLPNTTPYTATDSLGTVYTYTIGMTRIHFDVFDSLGNAHPLVATFTHTGGVQINGAPPGVDFDNNHWSWSIDVDPSDTTVAIPPDNITFTDPATGQLVRTGHSGSMGFNTDGSIKYWNPDDWNNTLAGVFPQWGLTADANVGAVIGLAGNTVPAGDVPIDAVVNPPPSFDLAPAAGSVLPAFSLTQQPLTLVYQTEVAPPVTPVPPAGTTAGSLVTLGYGDFATTAGVTPTQAYVQTVNLDFGRVATVTSWDNDWANQGGPTPEAGPGSLGDGWMDLISTPGNPGHLPPMATWLNDGGRNGLTQDTTGSFQLINGSNVYVPKFTAYLDSQDGYAEGILNSVNVNSNGQVVGAFSNGQSQALAQVAIANFQNPAGLAQAGATHFTTTANSGNAIVGTANSGGRGAVVGGVVEQSNVDLSEELTNMIVAQRGFEVNARLITTSDRVLQTLVSLGR